MDERHKFHPGGEEKILQPLGFKDIEIRGDNTSADQISQSVQTPEHCQTSGPGKVNNRDRRDFGRHFPTALITLQPAVAGMDQAPDLPLILLVQLNADQSPGKGGGG